MESFRTLHTTLCTGNRDQLFHRFPHGVVPKKSSQLVAANKELSERWEHDALTGLLSRATLAEKFQTIYQAGNTENSQLAVALIDLDNFKSINTFCGHGAGDKALGHLRSDCELLPESVLFRLGGDEFLAVQRSRVRRELIASSSLHESNEN